MSDLGPPRLDTRFWPGNSVTFTLNWSPAGFLAGRTWSATLDGADMSLNVNGDVMTVSLSEVQSETFAAGVYQWRLTETTGGASTVWLAGAWTATYETDEPTTEAFSISVEGATIEVTVLGGAASVLSVNGQTGTVILDAGDVGADPTGSAAAVAADLAALDTRVDGAEADVTALQAADTAMDGRVDTLEATATSHGTRLTTAETDINTLEAADTALDGRLDTAEASITALQGADTSLDSRLDTAESTLTGHGTRLTTAEADIDGLQAADISLDGRLDTAEATISSHGTRLTTAEGNITAHETRLDDAEADITADAAALSAHQADVWAHGQPRLHNWYTAGDWSALDVVVVSHPDHSTPVLTADDGVGVATGGPPSSGGNDRRIYVLNDPDLADVADAEVYCDLDGTAQPGIALRVTPTAAVMVWVNIFLGATGSLLQGVWEYDGTEWFDGNQAPTSSELRSAVAYADGNGTRVKVTTVLPHHLTAGSIINFDGSFGGFGQFNVATVIDSTTFTVSSATSGAWTGGTWRWVVAPGRRRAGVRLSGNTITWKQWLPDWEDEPAWGDSLRAVTNTLPATLAVSGVPPPASGEVGVAVGHLDASGTVRVNDLRVTNLDVIQSQEPVHPDQVRADLGEQTARIDRIMERDFSPSPADHNLIGWAFDPSLLAGGSILTGGQPRYTRIPIRESRPISTIYWGVSTAGASATAGQNHVGLYLPDGTRVATAGVDSSVASTGLKTTAITPVTVDDDWVWVAWLFNATTIPTLARAGTTLATTAAEVGLTAATGRFVTQGSGLTSLPASITPGSNSFSNFSGPWAALA